MLVEFLERDVHLDLVVMELPQVVLDEFDAGLVAMHLGADAIGGGVPERFLQKMPFGRPGPRATRSDHPESDRSHRSHPRRLPVRPAPRGG